MSRLASDRRVGEAECPATGIVFVRTLTTIHALGSLVLFSMTSYLVLGGSAERLAKTPGSRLMVDGLGPWLPVFLGSLGIFLGAMAWASRRHQRWAWGAAFVSYTIGVLGSLWEVSVGIRQAWLSVAINAMVVAMLSTPATRCVYFRKSATRGRRRTAATQDDPA